MTITLTTDAHARSEALDLINRRYAWRGYGANQKLSGRSNETTFSAQCNGTLIGTITLVTDTDRGLAVDQTFPDEMQFFRRKPMARLCELKKFAVEFDKPSLPYLAALFHFVFIYGTSNLLGTDLFIEVNPRHVLFYERLLAFERVGGLHTNDSVNAPSQLMWLSVDRIAQYVAAEGHDAGSRRSLYAYFLSQDEQAELQREMVERWQRLFPESYAVAS